MGQVPCKIASRFDVPLDVATQTILVMDQRRQAQDRVWTVDPLLTSELVHDPDKSDDEHGKNSSLSFMEDIFAGWRRGHFK